MKIYIKSDKKELIFIVENNFDPNEHGDLGIGLINLKRRLQLAYNKKHSFITHIENDVFKAKLSLKL